VRLAGAEAAIGIDSEPKMQAIVQNGWSPEFLELREIARPAVPDDGVRVRIRAASMNAFDLGLLRMRTVHVIARLMGGRPSPIRGGDLAGVVEACGSRVTRFKPGDEVFGVARGTFAECATTTEKRLAAKPPGLTFEQAAALPVAGCTALQGLRDCARVQPGQRVLVYGAGGGIGTFAVQIARALGARVSAVTSTEKLDFLRSIGAEQVVDYTREDFTLRNERYEVLFDVGADRSFADYRRVLVPHGMLVLAGAPKTIGALMQRLLKTLVQPALGYRRVLLSARATHDDLAALGQLVAEGKLAPAIDRTYPLRDVPDAFRYFASGQVRGKIVITIP